MSEQATNVVDEKDPDELLVQKEYEAGRLAYYPPYRTPEDLSNAKVIEGKGLGKLDGAIKIDPKDERYEERLKNHDEKVEKIENHQFLDEEEKVKVYLDVTPEMMKEGVVEVEFEEKGFWVLITTPTKKLSFALADQPIYAEIIPAESSWRINSKKTKIVITLKKKKLDYWPQLVHKAMNQHTGWN